jgi:integrase
VGIGTEVQRVRTIFRYGHEAGLMDQPVRFGPTFQKPSRKVMRLERAKRGTKMMEAADIRQILDAAPMPMKAMALLGVNCGFGNSDIRALPTKALDLKTGWVVFPRPKTGVERRCPLWPETVAALQEALASRPKAKQPGAEGLVFITKYGCEWGSRPKLAADGEEQRGACHDPVCGEFRKLLQRPRCPQCGKIEALDAEICSSCKWKPTKAVGWDRLHRPGLGYYALRHTFETIGGDSRDQVAVDHIMGHAREDMASVYRERIDDARLLAVTELNWSRRRNGRNGERCEDIALRAVACARRSEQEAGAILSRVARDECRVSHNG